MRIAFNPYISQTQYNKPSQAVNSNFGKKIQSQRIFNLEKELRPVWNKKDAFLAKLKEFSNIDFNTKNSDGDTLVMKLLKDGNSFIGCLKNMEKRGEIQGIDWNTTDCNGDNLLMAAAKTDDGGWWRGNCINSLIELTTGGKIDVNYINKKAGYSLIECIIESNHFSLTDLLKLKELDVNQTGHGKDTMYIIKKAIDQAPFSHIILKLLCHPKMDLKNCNLREIYNYIDNAPWHRWSGYDRKPLSDYDRIKYKEAVETAVRVHNVYKTKNYYEQNGVLTLDQIENHINNTDCQRAINMKLNCIGETIGHFLAETYVDPNDTYTVKRINKIIQALRNNTFYFWQRDDIGRTPPMLALECENFVVARAMLESMYDDEFKRFQNRGCWQVCHLFNEDNQEPDYRKVISQLEPARREEFDKLLTERINTRFR